jgi:hypothetical protein
MEIVQSRHILQTLDRLIGEMNTLRSQVLASLEDSSSKTRGSVRDAEYFGMWANREDMPEGSSRAWLEQWRSTQWSRSL